MKRSLALLLALALLLPLAACRKGPIGPTRPHETTTVTRTEQAQALPAMADLLANWAWGTSNGMGEEPVATHLAIIGYPKGCDFGKLDLAIGPFGQAKVKYAGEKRGDGSEQWYYPEYDAVTGPYFSFAQPTAVLAWESLFLVDSSALGAGLAHLQSKYDHESYAYPPVSTADIAIAETLHPGRGLMETQLLAAADDGSRICVFHYENTPDEGLFTIAYIRGGTVLAHDIATDNIGDDDIAYWRADAEGDDICLLEPVLLCRTREGVLLIVSWSAPEGRAELILREAGGALEDFTLSNRVYYYSPWDDSFWLDEYTEEDER